MKNLGTCMLSWCVIYIECILLLQHPNLLSEMTRSILCSSTIFSKALCSLLKFIKAFGMDFNNWKTWELPLLYKGSKPGSFMNSKFGNSFLRNAKGALSAAMITLSPDPNNSLIIWTHRVAWPKPQFNGHINIFFFNSLIFCKDNKSQ